MTQSGHRFRKPIEVGAVHRIVGKRQNRLFEGRCSEDDEFMMGIGRPRGLEHAPRRGETLDLGEKLSPLITTKRDECLTGVFQPITMREQRYECSGLTVTISPDHHEGGFRRMFCREAKG
jgi:hypothetical protein